MTKKIGYLFVGILLMLALKKILYNYHNQNETASYNQNIVTGGHQKLIKE
jgi:hypothetical protein